MNRKKMVKTTLLFGLFFLGLGGLLLHSRIHPVTDDGYALVPLIAGLLSIFILPALFYFRKTITLGYLINGFLVIIGTITMAHFSYHHFRGPLTIQGLLMNTLFADIALTWGKFAVGKALFDLEFLKSDTDEVAKGRYFRYPNMGWWLAHFVALSAVYALGHILWR